ncbi:MAG: hypothetical protein PVH88_24220 [Ignavibacteria bacterium]|jgi:hypothetical protein
MRIAKAINLIIVGSTLRGKASKVLEPYEGKLFPKGSIPACTVLRGLGDGDISRLPGRHKRKGEMKLILFYLSIVLVVACSENGEPLLPENQSPDFGIYFLKDSLLTGSQIKEIDIDSLELNDEPWLSEENIDFYDYSSHCIYLIEDKSYFFDIQNGNFTFDHHLINKPFVVIAESERCYVGTFHSILLSSLPIGPYIDELDINYYPSDILHISENRIGNVDNRCNSKLQETLIKNNKYHAGLEIELKSLKIIENSDTSTIEYSMKISNNDNDDLLVIDSDKIGSKLFHYFTNGPVLIELTSSTSYFSQYKEVITPEENDIFNEEWYTLIKSKQSIERTIQLKGYPHFLNGTYDCNMNFANPKTISKDNRFIDGNRIWIGEIGSDILSLNL